jgi:hypothetical protein
MPAATPARRPYVARGGRDRLEHDRDRGRGEAAHHHDPLEGDVDHSRSLAEHAAEGRDDDGRGVDEGDGDHGQEYVHAQLSESVRDRRLCGATFLTR